MKSTTFVFLFLASCFIVLPTAAAAEVETNPVVPQDRMARIYDLSQFMTAYKALEGDSLISLFPFDPNRFDGDEWLEEEQEPTVPDPELIRDALIFLMGDEAFERSGIIFELLDARILIIGPAALHDKVAATLSYLDSWLNRTVTLDIEVFVEKKSGLDAAADVAAVRRSVEMGLLEPILKRTMPVVVGESVEICEGSRTSVVTDYDPEIAQASIACEPIIVSIFTGLQFAARPLLAPNGRDISLVLAGSNSCYIEPIKTRDLLFSGRFCADQFTHRIHVSQTVDDPKIQFASLYTVVPMENGQPALLRTAFPHLKGLGSLVIIVTSRIEPLPDPPARSDGLLVTGWDLGFLLADKLEFYPFYRTSHNSWEWIHDEAISPPHSAAFGPQSRIYNGKASEAIEFILNDHDFHDEVPDEWGECDYFRMTDQFLLLGPAEYKEDVASRIDSLFGQRGSAIQTAIEFIVADGPAVLIAPDAIRKRGKLAGTISLPMSQGGTLISFAGLERYMVADYDVDVANNSACSHPNVVGLLDGMMLRMLHEPPISQGGSDGFLRVQLLMNCLRGPVKSDKYGKNDGIIGVVDCPEFNNGYLDVRFRTDGVPHLLGSIPYEQDGKTRTLYAIGQAHSLR